MGLPDIVTREEWLIAREELLAKEKAATRARDALNAARRRLPMVEVDKEYYFDGSDGKATLLDLFDGREQLIVYHFMFAPEWEAGCRSCSAFLDQIGHLAHLRARGTNFVAVSRAPYTALLTFKARMGWTVPWYSTHGGDFNHDFGAFSAEEPCDVPAINCFLRDGDRVFHTYATFARGLDGLGSTTSLLDLTALGRQEEWEEPRGRASALGAPAGSARVRYHDEYED
ncbi:MULTISPECIES: DUF899 domain-containing protein [Streptomyces]|uniref:DUF899 domain-containing protein n=1 Tax=Streptomyces TaxID=1883 RepID=UPI001E2EFF72|nr:MULTISPECIES: DUF899 domain-containing protein [Streptomyces]UFQ15007.1 DUF899 domain-containing protein [Streptomyces huasconensis]WCL84613.1 DUF899 domain-containing protein [Streptomyces sp. JCM 35825]